jgi:hypothetical protein
MVLAMGLAAARFAFCAPGAGAQVTPPAFVATTDATGVLVNLTIPGAPVTSTPVDSGGPTAQAALDSVGDTGAYAAFPDPGSFVVSLPGLLAGLLGTGLASLPPIPTPALPSYPFEVTATSLAPQVSSGAGPYQISASATTSEAAASSTAGLQTAEAGNAALLTSSSSVTTETDGSVVATATASIDGLTIGPLTIGQITSTATQTLSPVGTSTQQPSLSISGALIGSLPVSMSTTGLTVGASSLTLPVSSSVSSLLNHFGMTMTMLTPQFVDGTLTGPAVQITVPVNGKADGVGTGGGAATLTLGFTAVSLGGSGSGTAGEDENTNPSSETGVGNPNESNPPSIGSSPVGEGFPTPTSGAGSSSVVPLSSEPSTATGARPLTASRGSPVRSTPVDYATIGTFDIRDAYLLFIITALAVFATAQMVRRRGVREPWTSSGS